MKKISSIFVSFAVLHATSLAAIVVNITAGQLSNAAGVGLPDGSLLQLVNLGPDGVFNPINIADGNSGNTQWTSGDDTLITGSAGTDFTAQAFDFVSGPDSPNPIAPATMDRVFTITVPTGSKIGLRWFPGLLATNFGVITLSAGQQYGQFLRDGSPEFGGAPQFGGATWVAPADGLSITFDTLGTAAIGGTDTDSRGNANFVVVPEPASIALSLMGAAGLAMLRRRRA